MVVSGAAQAVARIIADIRPYASKTLGSIRIDVDEVRKLVEWYDALASAPAPAIGEVDAVREAVTIERQACAYLQFEAPPWVSNDYSKGSWDAISAYRRAINVRSALSPAATPTGEEGSTR